jgi:hypothetical protein
MPPSSLRILVAGNQTSSDVANNVASPFGAIPTTSPATFATLGADRLAFRSGFRTSASQWNDR